MNISKISLTLATIALVVVASPVAARPAQVPAVLNLPGNTPGTPADGKILLLPTAAGNSPVISLGPSIDPQSGKLVEGFAFIHYKEGRTHKTNHNKGPKNGGDTVSSCYAFLAKGAKWKTTENYLVDATNNAGLSVNDVESNIATALSAWDSEVTTNIFGSKVAGTVDGVDTSSPDGKNEVLFGDISSSGAIAVTIVWGYFNGPPFARELVEWDIQFDDTDFDWAVNGDPNAMDFLNIAVHEVGHAAGMGHPDVSCTEESMHRYASEGEIKKQDLNAGDITGIKKLY